ncbi:S-adenosylmethionine carrier 1, chloroplastic/mitochondrial [Artemisia annua]|uniref:S-adenosylmethionine carrier 1, chloroplastic/mitochondrial n=1 Tax=Artemisia annua TaxID=35608 RepID=A0A2U1P7G8_ARTAN|nr:S-adenosylmethionine carrier 1, chloroplastic/mitochondrial [Artemisia annua]
MDYNGDINEKGGIEQSIWVMYWEEKDEQITNGVHGYHKTFRVQARWSSSASAIFIGVYETTKQKLLKSFPENFSALAHLVVKQRMQTGHFASALDAVRLIVAKEGFKGLLRYGYSSFLLRDLPFDAIQFWLYEQLRIGYKLAAKRDLSDPENAVIGAFARSGKPVQKYLTLCRHYSKGRRTFCIFKGMGPRVLWIGIGGSIFFGVLERANQLLAQRRPEDPDSNSVNYVQMTQGDGKEMFTGDSGHEGMTFVDAFAEAAWCRMDEASGRQNTRVH